MSNIYEALEHAGRKIHAVEPCPDEPARFDAPDLSVSGGTDPDMEDEMITLYQTITSSLPGIEHRSVLFVGSRSNEGTSTVAAAVGTDRIPTHREERSPHRPR